MGGTATVFSDVVCELGEGPTYDPLDGTAYWFDILDRRLLSKRWPDGETIVTDLPEMASALAVVDESRHAILTETGLHLRDKASGRLEQLQPIEADNPATRSNDARVHPSGAFWVSTMGKKAERGAGSIYWYRRGELRMLFDGITIPNAICFSPDGGHANFADTDANRLYRVACDPETGLPTGEPRVILDEAGKPGGIDGAVVDRDGDLWVARWGTGRLDCVGADGTLKRSIELPARQASCPAFAGPEADRLIVTSAWEGMDDAARGADPLGGRIFLLEQSFKGRHEPLLAI